LFSSAGFVLTRRALERGEEEPMFETSVIAAQALAPRRRYLLSVSLVAHSAAIVGAIAISVASVSFPKTAPDQFAMLQPFAAVAVPPPAGTPQGNNRPVTQPQQHAATPAPQPQQQTAPSVIPDAVTPDPAATSSAAEVGEAASEIPGTGRLGVPGGDPNSVATTDTLPGTGTAPVADQVYRVGGDVKPPRVLQRVDPRYPPAMIAAKLGATVTARCTIDRNGAVRDIDIIQSTFPAFNPAVVEAMSRWRFAPGSLNGNAVDTVFELTVRFAVK
jgi:TonB family protein